MLLKTFLKRLVAKQMDELCDLKQFEDVEPGDTLNIEISIEVPEHVQSKRKTFCSRKSRPTRNVDSR